MSPHTGPRECVVRVSQNIGNVDSTVLKANPCYGSSYARGNGIFFHPGLLFSRYVVTGCWTIQLPVYSVDPSLISAAQSRCVLNEGFKNRLQIERRATDYLEHFACRRLLFQCFSEIPVANLQLLE